MFLSPSCPEFLACCHAHSVDPWHSPEGTIYENEEGLSQSSRIEVDPKKTKFIKELKSRRRH